MMAAKSPSQVGDPPTDPGRAPEPTNVSDQAPPPQTAAAAPATGHLHPDGHLKPAHRKVDARLVLWYSAVYLVMRIHTSNISNTAIINLEQGDGIREQLGGLTSGQWAWALSVFYYPYILLEPLATLALRRFTPRVWMARIMVTWVGYLPSYGVWSVPRLGDWIGWLVGWFDRL